MRPVMALLVLACTACSVRRAPVFSGSFRLTRIGGEPKLLAPSISDTHPLSEPVQLAIGNPRGVNGRCAENGPLFRFTASRNGGWTAQTPAPASGTAPEAIHKDLDLLLSRLDALEARGCLPRGQSAEVGNLIEDSLAVKPNQGLFFRLHFRPEGLLDLLPGVSIAVQRAWFRPGEGGQIINDIQHYVGVSTHRYDIARDARGRIAFQLTATQKSTTLPTDRRLPDSRLATVIKPMPFARLFLLGEAVARRTNRVAMIVEAASRESMAAATEMIRTRTDIGCAPQLLKLGVSCISFEGSVVISPELRVFRQGAPVNITAGAELRNLPGLPQNVLASLRVERLFHGSYYPVKFTPGDPEILTLSLVSGDRISW